jgi:hypothetical protein
MQLAAEWCICAPQKNISPADICQAAHGMAKHLHMRLAAIAAAHECQQGRHATTVYHQLTAGFAVACAELNSGDCCDDLCMSTKEAPAT